MAQCGRGHREQNSEDGNRDKDFNKRERVTSVQTHCISSGVGAYSQVARENHEGRSEALERQILASVLSRAKTEGGPEEATDEKERHAEKSARCSVEQRETRLHGDVTERPNQRSTGRAEETYVLRHDILPLVTARRFGATHGGTTPSIAYSELHSRYLAIQRNLFSPGGSGTL